MRVVKMASIPLLFVWMAYITWNVEQTKRMAEYSCGIAFAQGMPGHGPHPIKCPLR